MTEGEVGAFGDDGDANSCGLLIAVTEGEVEAFDDDGDGGVAGPCEFLITTTENGRRSRRAGLTWLDL